jgi:hypothetical protein
MESGKKITVFDMVLPSLFPVQIQLFAANCMQALKQKDRAKPPTAHLIRDVLGALLYADFVKLFNEFFVADSFTGKLGP